MTPVEVDALARLTARYVVTSRGCWEWLGTLGHNGRGVMRYKGRRVTAYRVSYMLYHGEELQPEETIDHLCHNKVCVNPAHLEKCSLQENHRRNREWNKTYVLQGAA